MSLSRRAAGSKEMRQQNLPLTPWARQRELLRLASDAMPASCGSFGKTQPRGVSGKAVLAVLRIIDGRAGEKGWCTASLETIAKECHWSLDVVSKAVRFLRSTCSILIEEEMLTDSGQRYGKRSFRRQICWANLEEFISQTDTARCGVATPHRAPRPYRTQQVTHTAPNQTCPHTEALKKEAPPPTPSEPAGATSEVTWERVVVEMVELGTKVPGSAIERARNLGCSARQAWERCQWFRSVYVAYGWGGQELWLGIVAAAPGLLPHQGWPDLNATAKSQSADRERNRFTAQATAEMRADVGHRLSDRERRLGKQLDAMSLTELLELTSLDAIRKQIRKSGTSGPHRAGLLVELEKRGGK